MKRPGTWLQQGIDRDVVVFGLFAILLLASPSSADDPFGGGTGSKDNCPEIDSKTRERQTTTVQARKQESQRVRLVQAGCMRSFMALAAQFEGKPPSVARTIIPARRRKSILLKGIKDVALELRDSPSASGTFSLAANNPSPERTLAWSVRAAPRQSQVSVGRRRQLFDWLGGTPDMGVNLWGESPLYENGN